MQLLRQTLAWRWSPIGHIKDLPVLPLEVTIQLEQHTPIGTQNSPNLPSNTVIMANLYTQ